MTSSPPRDEGYDSGDNEIPSFHAFSYVDAARAAKTLTLDKEQFQAVISHLTPVFQQRQAAKIDKLQKRASFEAAKAQLLEQEHEKEVADLKKQIADLEKRGDQTDGDGLGGPHHVCDIRDCTNSGCVYWKRQVEEHYKAEVAKEVEAARQQLTSTHRGLSGMGGVSAAYAPVCTECTENRNKCRDLQQRVDRIQHFFDTSVGCIHCANTNAEKASYEQQATQENDNLKNRNKELDAQIKTLQSQRDKLQADGERVLQMALKSSSEAAELQTWKDGWQGVDGCSLCSITQAQRNKDREAANATEKALRAENERIKAYAKSEWDRFVEHFRATSANLVDRRAMLDQWEIGSAYQPQCRCETQNNFPSSGYHGNHGNNGYDYDDNWRGPKQHWNNGYRNGQGQNSGGPNRSGNNRGGNRNGGNNNGGNRNQGGGNR